MDWIYDVQFGWLLINNWFLSWHWFTKDSRNPYIFYCFSCKHNAPQQGEPILLLTILEPIPALNLLKIIAIMDSSKINHDSLKHIAHFSKPVWILTSSHHTWLYSFWFWTILRFCIVTCTTCTVVLGIRWGWIQEPSLFVSEIVSAILIMSSWFVLIWFTSNMSPSYRLPSWKTQFHHSWFFVGSCHSKPWSQRWKPDHQPWYNQYGV